MVGTSKYLVTTVKWIGQLLSAEEVLSKFRSRVVSQKELGGGG